MRLITFIGFARRLTLPLAMLAAAWPARADYSMSGKAPVVEPPPPQLLSRAGFDQKLNNQIPLDLEFTDSSGQAVHLSDYFHGKPVILNLAYYQCPMLCTMVLNGLVDSMKGLPFELGRDYEVVTVSFDSRETAELAARKKQTYLEHFGRPGAEPYWHFLVGSQPAIQRLTDAVGFKFVFDPESGQFAHASGIMVATPAGKLSHYFYGIEYPSPQLRLALVEASAGRIGTPVDQLVLFCYHYNPVTGKFTLAIMNLIRLGAAATVVLLGVFLTFPFFHRRRLAAAAAHPVIKPRAQGLTGQTGR